MILRWPSSSRERPTTRSTVGCRFSRLLRHPRRHHDIDDYCFRTYWYIRNSKNCLPNDPCDRLRPIWATSAGTPSSEFFSVYWQRWVLLILLCCYAAVLLCSTVCVLYTRYVHRTHDRTTAVSHQVCKDGFLEYISISHSFVFFYSYTWYT